MAEADIKTGSADTDSVEDLIIMYDEMFAYRYTDKDDDYVDTISKPIPQCPCVPGYFIRSRNQYDNRNQDRRGGWGNRGRGHWQGHGRGNGHHGNHYQGRDEGQGHYRRNYDQDRRGGGHHRHYDGQRYNPY